MLPPAGQIFEKLHFLWNFANFGVKNMLLLSKGLARVLPPAGQIFENGTSLQIVSFLAKHFAPSKQGSGKGVASGGSDF